MNKNSLGRIPSPYDARDFMLSDYIPLGAVQAVTSKAWVFNHAPLDQGETPHCVGFSMADWGICEPVIDPYGNPDGDRFYYLCKAVDGEPKAEDGSTVRSAAKVLQQLGKIKAYAFAANMTEIKYWLLNRGPVIMGTVWTNDMFTPDSSNHIHPTGAVAGGHAYLVNEWTAGGFLGIQNSWGTAWGRNGKAYISAKDFTKLFRHGGECLAAVELA